METSFLRIAWFARFLPVTHPDFMCGLWRDILNKRVNLVVNTDQIGTHAPESPSCTRA
jgi:hypothetical protein